MVSKNKIESGDIIEWCDEQFEVLEVSKSRDTGKVRQGNKIIRNFKFNFNGEESKIVKKNSKTK